MTLFVHVCLYMCRRVQFFFFSLKHSSHFSSGIISTRQALDRETVPHYHLIVLAVDGGDLSCSMDVYITLTDVNDNQPVFSQYIYDVSILESAEVNTILTRVSSVDNDLGINRKVRYAMQESDGHFTIDPLSGVVSLTEVVDREHKDVYNLTLYAYDQVGGMQESGPPDSI